MMSVVLTWNLTMALILWSGSWWFISEETSAIDCEGTLTEETMKRAQAEETRSRSDSRRSSQATGRTSARVSSGRTQALLFSRERGTWKRPRTRIFMYFRTGAVWMWPGFFSDFLAELVDLLAVW